MGPTPEIVIRRWPERRERMCHMMWSRASFHHNNASVCCHTEFEQLLARYFFLSVDVPVSLYRADERNASPDRFQPAPYLA
jgi:hypothetical protein